MTTHAFRKTTTGFITTFGTAAHQAIGLYREAGERVAAAADERWSEAFKQSKPQLSAETRRNAAHAKQVFAGYYAKGLALSCDGAEVVVDTVVGAALAAVERAATLQQSYAQKAA